MSRVRAVALLFGVGVALAAFIHLGRRAATAHGISGGVLIGDAAAYDVMTRLLLGSFFDGIAADVAQGGPAGAKLLEVGCGPGLLSVRLAGRNGIDVTGVDLDPHMIERARSNADRAEPNADRPSFVVGDVAALPFPDGSFDIVVSSLSMHHWSDPQAGLTEIGRVLRPGARALIWDFPSDRPHPFAPRHEPIPDPFRNADQLPLRIVASTAWRWPWRFSLVRRTELVSDGIATEDDK